MTYKINILKNANTDLDWLRKNDRKNYCKCFDLVREIMEHPREGTGKPERLKYFDKEVYSRRVSREDRLVYTIYEDMKEIGTSSFRRHYRK
ncbi:Txe/YoeB family addiction module toxin [Desulfonema magnum]|uniref:Putative mRNA interferase YoeB n=1 Tax=Desulfonema magnum TaxID=45655 RepID=A0A975BIX8_9BACT|nr:Txe/YoeB family addiction module toxin [Desulfonema magnum]QTA85960.1 Toxin-antitoxin system, toxin component, RelE/ParE-like [Desulfonema magnum]